MKTLILSALLFSSANALAMTSKFVEGRDALEIVHILNRTLGVQGEPRGHSPETMCYNIRSYSMQGLSCERALCTPEGEYKEIDTAVCTLKTPSAKELKKIRDILRAAGLNPANRIFY